MYIRDRSTGDDCFLHGLLLLSASFAVVVFAKGKAKSVPEASRAAACSLDRSAYVSYDARVRAASSRLRGIDYETKPTGVPSGTC